MTTLQDRCDEIRAVGLAYPETVEESPWGERVLKVRKKVFVFLVLRPARLALSCKLPQSAADALEEDWAQPMGYGMGRHGWVTLTFLRPESVPMAQVRDWLDESYRAVAPKRLLKALDAGLLPAPAPRAPRAPTGETVLLIGADPLRLARAQEALGLEGVDAAGVGLAQALDAAAQGAPDAVVVDVTRSARSAIALLGDLSLLTAGAPVLVAGIRASKMEGQVRAMGRFAALSREAPGEPVFVAEVLEALRQ